MKDAHILKGLIILTLITLPFSVGALLQQEEMSHQNHQQHMQSTSSPLTMPGNAVFGTIQEVIRKLEADPDTDWSQVDLEALRQHLIDMHHFTMNVRVVSKSSISNGVEIVVEPTIPGAMPSLERVFQAHPPMLRAEKGWAMEVSENGDQFVLEVTTDDASDV